MKLFSWIAGIALAVAAVFFLLYSVEHGWLQPPVRMAIGILVGLALLVVCELRAARRYPVTANAMDGAGIAILFSTFFAAHSLWQLVPAGLTFFFMILVTAVAVLLSIRRPSLFIALLGLVGGFSTPALLSSGENRPIPLFAYLLMLNAGLAWVAYTKRWPILAVLTLGFTALYQWGWVMRFLDSTQLPLALAIFLVFPILGSAALALAETRRSGEPRDPLFWRTASIGAALPLLFALHLAAVPAYGARFGLLFGFLFLVDAGLALIAARRGPELLHLGGAASTVLVLAIWLGMSYTPSAWPAVLGFLALFVALYLTAPWLARRAGRGFTGAGAHAALAAPLLLCAFPVLVAIEPRAAAPAAPFAVLFLLLAACAAFALLTGMGTVHFVAAFFALAAEAVWSARYLDPEHLLQGLALYAVFGLFYVGVPLAARRFDRPLRPDGAGGVVLLCGLALLFFLAAGPAAQAALWGLALLLALLNVGLFVQPAPGRLSLLRVAGIVLSWLVLAVWWATATVATVLVPALVVVAGFSLLTMAGNIWLGRANEAGARRTDPGIYLGLIGHLFLIFVASQASLAVPPWPLFGVLALLDLAIGAAALYARRGELHFASMAASPAILILWTVVARSSPWPAVAIVAAAVLALGAGLWIVLARRVGLDRRRFSQAAAASLALAQAVAVVAAAQPGSPGVAFLTAAHVVFLAALLALAWTEGWHWLPVYAVAPAAVAVLAWQDQHPELWREQLVFAGALYAVFVAFPLLLGRRAGRLLGPYLAAVAAGVPFFFCARAALLEGELGGVIGILPITQALLMAGLLAALLRIEPPGARALGRLALVAGAALAGVTVAIPLQLEKAWITIAWALEGAALAWLYTKIPHRGLLTASGGLLTVVFVRLALNPSVLVYEPRGELRIWNWYLYTYLVSAAALFVAARFLQGTEDRIAPRLPRLSTLLPGAGTILLFWLLNIEIADFYSTGTVITFKFTATLAQDLTYTLGWALFGMSLLAAGIVARSRPARIAALALLVLTISKCFLHDVGRLGGLYRVGSFVGLAICLALVALALQRFVLKTPEETR